MIKIKIFTQSETLDKFEERINKWLSEKPSKEPITIIYCGDNTLIISYNEIIKYAPTTNPDLF